MGVELNPHTVVWEYTLACNSACIHCGSSAKKKRPYELNTEESLDLVDQIADIGFQEVVISGGEPTLRRDWSTVAQRIKDKDMRFSLISNALAWNEEIFDTVAQLKPYAIGLSVDGEPALHDFLRGAKGSHYKVFTAMKELKKRSVPICAVTAVNKRNLEELTQVRNRLIVYGVDAWQVQIASPMGRMKDNEDIVLDDIDFYRLAEFIVESRERLPHINVQAADCMGYYGLLEEGLRDANWDGCQAGLQGLGIESDGTVKGCLSLRSPLAREGNVRFTSLKDIWENPHNFIYNRHFKESELRGECTSCEYGVQCRGGCQSQSLAFFNELHHAPYCLSRYEKKLFEGKK